MNGGRLKKSAAERSESLFDDFALPASLDFLAQAREHAAQVAERVGYSIDALNDFRLAVGEAFVNAVRHGCGSDNCSETGATVGITTRLSHDSIVMEIRDPGCGFDVEHFIIPPVTELRPDGRGILFMKLVMDTVDYDCSDGCIVRLTKLLPNALGKEASGKLPRS